MNCRTSLQNTHFCFNLLKGINKPASSSKIARNCIYEMSISESKLTERYMKLCVLKMNPGHMADIEVIVYLSTKNSMKIFLTAVGDQISKKWQTATKLATVIKRIQVYLQI